MRIKEDGFYIQEKKSYLLSGEIHYFRIEKQFWKDRLEKLKNCGLNTVGFYIPWVWHEHSEGQFDFEGETDPKRDLISFLDLTRELDLYVIARPGPYNFAELLYKGIPKWFIDKYPNTLMLNQAGEGYDKSVVSFMHPTFIEYTKKWYDQILPILKDNLITQGGNIALLQICNEIGSLPFWKGSYDYNPETLGLGNQDGFYPGWLTNKYHDINVLNERYGTNYKAFLEVEPPKGAWTNVNELRRCIDWDEFYLFYHKKYVDILYEYVRNKGIDVPIPLNIPNTHETMRFRDIFYSYNPKDVFCGHDLYYVFSKGLDHESLSTLAVLGMEISKVFFKVPPFILELQSGFFNDYPRVYPNQLSVLYHTLFAHGMRAVNWYLFAGGENAPQLGETKYHDWQAPIGADGTIRMLYDQIKSLIAELGEKNVINTEKVYDDITIGVDPNSWFGSYLFRKLQAFDFVYDPRDFYVSFIHLFLTLFVNNIHYKLVDLNKITNEDLQKHKLLWVPSVGIMNKDIQYKLINYAKDGGTLIINPSLPKFDENVNESDIFTSELNISESKLDTCQIDILNFQDVNVSFTNEIHSEDEESIVATYENKKLGVIKRVGLGKIVFLGFMWEYKHKYQSQAILALLDKLGFKQKITCSEEIHIVRRNGEQDLLFLINYHPIPIEFSYTCSNKEHSDKLGPYSCKIVKL